MATETHGLRQLGEFPGPRRPIIKSPKNPLDKATIVSIYPKEIIEHKHTVEPGYFKIPAGSLESPALLQVGTSSWYSHRGEEHPTLEIPVSAVAVAESIIRDWSNGMLACDMSTRMPGLFFVPGAVSLLKIKTEYQADLATAESKQNAWYTELVRLGDSLWARSNNNPLTISDEMRLAARHLNMNDKPWLLDFKIIQSTPCFACGTPKNPAYPVCPACRAVDSNHPNAKDLKFAAQ